MLIGDLSAYAGLFLAAFLAATIFPAQSEALLLVMVAAKAYPIWTLLVVASIGNILGSVFNWWLGRGIEHFKYKKWFPVKEASLAKAQQWYGRYGRWSLLLSWVPVIGDPITVAAGVMRERLLPFVYLVGAAKILRYVLIVTLFERLT
jgi:membrane protein YqaA with SNARE-associated domain